MAFERAVAHLLRAGEADVGSTAAVLGQLITKQRTTTTVSCRLATSSTHHTDGNAAFARSDFLAAARSYTLALAEPPGVLEVNQSALLANRSAALLRLKLGLPAFDDALASVAASPTYCKAWFRLSEALSATPSVLATSTHFQADIVGVIARLRGSPTDPGIHSHAVQLAASLVFEALRATQPTLYIDSRLEVASVHHGTSGAGGVGLCVSTPRAPSDGMDGNELTAVVHPGNLLLREPPFACIAAGSASLLSAGDPEMAPRCSWCLSGLTPIRAAPLPDDDSKLLRPAASPVLYYGIPCVQRQQFGRISSVLNPGSEGSANVAYESRHSPLGCGAQWCSAPCMLRAVLSGDHAAECSRVDAACGDTCSTVGAAAACAILPLEVLLALRMARRHRDAAEGVGSRLCSVVFGGANGSADAAATSSFTLASRIATALLSIDDGGDGGKRSTRLHATASLTIELLRILDAGVRIEAVTPRSTRDVHIDGALLHLLKGDMKTPAASTAAALSRPPAPSTTTLTRLLGQISCNAHSVKGMAGLKEEGEQATGDATIGIGVYALASLFQHSCCPAALASFAGEEEEAEGAIIVSTDGAHISSQQQQQQQQHQQQAILRGGGGAVITVLAAVPLRPLDGVTISYGPTLLSQPDACERSAFLARAFGFSCSCPACCGGGGGGGAAMQRGSGAPAAAEAAVGASGGGGMSRGVHDKESTSNMSMAAALRMAADLDDRARVLALARQWEGAARCVAESILLLSAAMGEEARAARRTCVPVICMTERGVGASTGGRRPTCSREECIANAVRTLQAMAPSPPPPSLPLYRGAKVAGPFTAGIRVDDAAAAAVGSTPRLHPLRPLYVKLEELRQRAVAAVPPPAALSSQQTH